jgi:hypothetical protein
LNHAGRKRKSGVPVPIAEPPAPNRIRYFDKDAISEHLYCPICQDVFNYPYALMCGHVFCENCISEWLKHQRNCPECRTHADMRNAHKDLTAHKFLDSVPVYCSFLGCSWIGRMDALQSHVSECECNPAKLPDYMVAREPSNSSAAVDDSDGPIEGTTSLRMKLFKGENRQLLDSAASGNLSILGNSIDPQTSSSSMPRLSDLAKDLVTSSDVIARNRARPRHEDVDFVELSDS